MKERKKKLSATTKKVYKQGSSAAESGKLTTQNQPQLQPPIMEFAKGMFQVGNSSIHHVSTSLPRLYKMLL